MIEWALSLPDRFAFSTPDVLLAVAAALVAAFVLGMVSGIKGLL